MAGIAAAGLLACAPALAEADGKPPASRVDLNGATAEHISGEVSSAAARCLGGRTIRVEDASNPAPVAILTSDAEGGFEIEVADLPAGAAQLTVTMLRPPPGRQRACTADSASLAIDQGALSGGVSGDAFRGRLTSSAARCVPQRTVEVYEVSSEPAFVGFNFTDEAGDWVLAAAGGTYEARAVPAILGGPDAFSYCRALVSPPWAFEEPF